MTIARHLKQAGLALLMISSVAVLQSAYAVGTPSGTTISNQATVNYSVGGVSQTPINSSVATFVVDSRIDLTVTRLDTSPVIARPNETAVVAAFTVTNTGNSIQSYRLTATDLSGGTVFGNTDNLDALVLTTAVDTNADGDYDTGVDQIGNLGDIAPAAVPAPVRVFVLANIPAGATNGQFASISLAAAAATAGSAGATLATETNTADDPAVVDVVFADSGENGAETVDSQYVIQSATLTVLKTAAVISDPFNGASNPKAIPGAIVEYTISIQNAGGAAATTVNVTDPIPANTQYVAGSMTRGGSAVTDAADGDGAQANGAPVTAIAVTVPTIAASTTATVTFRVTVQ